MMSIYSRRLRSFSSFHEGSPPLMHQDLTGLLTGFFEADYPGSKKVTLIRHAQSYGNLKKLLYGSTDFELTPFGVQQAKSLEHVLASLIPKMDQLYCSNLIRTLQTGQFSLGLTLEEAEDRFTKTAGLNEIDFGSLEESPFDRMTYDECRFVFNLFLEGRLFYNIVESPDKCSERLFGFFASLQANRNSVVYSHSGMTYVILRKMGLSDIHLNNCGVICFTCDADGIPKKVYGYWNGAPTNEESSPKNSG